ncbi:FAD-binding oxidoreductase, partial [Gemmatimonadota bacterium]
TLGIVTSVSIRLFPAPEGEVTLLCGADRAEDLVPAARAITTSSLSVAALELVEDSGLGEAFGGDGALLVIRLLASRVAVAEMEGRVAEMLPAFSLRRLESRESEEFHRALAGREVAGSMVLRLALLPRRLDVLLERARAFLGTGETGTIGEVRMAAHVGAGILRLTFQEPTDGSAMLGVGTLAESLRGLRGFLEREGGTLTVSHGPPSLVREVGAWGDPGEVAHLHAGLKREFDPAGILAPGRFVG